MQTLELTDVSGNEVKENPKPKKWLNRAQRRSVGFRGPIGYERWPEGENHTVAGINYTVRNQAWVGGVSERKRQEAVNLLGLA